MADFLTRLAERTLRTVPVAQPILSSRFAPEPSMAPTLPEVEIWTTQEQRGGHEQGRGPAGRGVAGRGPAASLHVSEEPTGRGPAASLHVSEENMIPAAEPSIDEEHAYTITHQPPSAGEIHRDQSNAVITRRSGGSEEVGGESLRQDVGVGNQNVGTGLVPVRGASLAPAQNFQPVVDPHEQRREPVGREPAWGVQPASLHFNEESTMPGATHGGGGNMVIEVGTSESPILEIDEQVHHEHIAPIQSSMHDTSANPKTPTQQPQHLHSYGGQVHERSEGLAPVMEIHEEHIYTSTPSNTLASDEIVPPALSSNILRGTPISEDSKFVQARPSESGNISGANPFPEVGLMPHREKAGAETIDTPIIEVYEHPPVYSPSMQAAGNSSDNERVETSEPSIVEIHESVHHEQNHPVGPDLSWPSPIYRPAESTIQGTVGDPRVPPRQPRSPQLHKDDAPEKVEGLLPAIDIHEEHIHTLVRQNVPTGNVRSDQPLVREERSSARQSMPVGGEMAALVPPVVESHEHIPIYLQPDRSSPKSGSSEMDAGSSSILELHERIVESDRQNVTGSPKASSQSQHHSHPHEDRPLIKEVVHIEEQVETTQLIAPGIVPLQQQPPVSRAAQRQSTSNGKQSSMPLIEQYSAKSAPDLASAAPSIRVTIGRIDVRAITPPPAAPAPRPKPGRSGSTLSLDDYLKRNRGGEL